MSGAARGGAEPAVEDVSGMDISDDVWDDAGDGGDGGADPEPQPRQPAARQPAARPAAKGTDEGDPEEPAGDDPDGTGAEEDPDAETNVDPDAEPTEEEIEAEAESALEAIAPPQNWPAEEKKFFGALPPTLQHAYMNRARSLMADYTKKTQEIARVRQNYAELDRLIQPRAQAWAVAGMSPSMAVTQLLALSDFASAKPLEFIQYFAEQRGIDLSKAIGNAQQGQGGYVDPQIRALQEQLATVKRESDQVRQEQTRRLEAAKAERQQQATEQLARQIEQFATATDAKGRLVNPYFNEVMDEVTKLLTSGVASGLDEAYKMAVRVNPAVHAKMLARSRSLENVKARARAEAARRAAGSVAPNGSGGGRGTVQKKPDDMNVGELLRAVAAGQIT